jgi:hypothetical protein
MSRKTRKLIWSAPLVAALAVIGALVIFAVQTPGGARAHEVTLPGAPTNLQAAAVNAQSIELTWVAPADDGGSAITGYRIDYLDGGSGIIWQQLVADTGNASAEYTDDFELSANEDRAYRVLAINAAGTGPTSAVAYGNANSTPALDAPGKVVGLRVRAAGHDGLNLSWSAPADDGGSPITSYRIAMATGGEDVPGADAGVTVSPDFAAADAAVVIDTGSNATSHSLTGLRASQTWQISVRAVNKSGAAGADAVSTVEPEVKEGTTDSPIAPAPPTELRAVTTQVTTDATTTPNNTAVALYWYWPAHDGGADITNFRIEVKRPDKNWPEPSDAAAADNASFNAALAGADGNAVFLAALNTSASADYSHASIPDDLDGDGTADTNPTDRTLTYRVRTVTAGRLSAPSNAYTVTLDNADLIAFVEADGTTPITPTATPPTPAVAGVLNLDWGAVPNAGTGFRVDYSVGATGTNLQWQPVERNTIFTDLPYEHAGLDAGLHRYRVFAQPLRRAQAPAIFEGTAAGASAAAVPGAPTGLTATVRNAGQIDLAWTAPESDGGADITGYRVVMATGTGILPDGTASDDSPVFTAANATATIDTDSEATGYSVTGLPAGTTWHIAVHAVNSAGNSAASGTVTGTTFEFDTPAPPVGLLAESARDSNLADRNQRGVLLLWNAPEPPVGAAITGYQIQWKAAAAADADYASLTVTAANALRTHHTHADEPAEDEARVYRVRSVANSTAAGAPDANQLASAWAVAGYPADTTHNHAPTAGDDIAAQTVTVGETVMVQSTITDDDAGDTLTWAWSSSDPAIATVEMDATDGSMATVEGVAAGSAIITVTATDAAGESATQTIMVTVNAVPMAVDKIDAVTVTEGMMSKAMDVADYFSDTEGDTLTYTAESDMKMYATADIPAGTSMLTITGVAAGMATITVTATDTFDASVDQTFMVTVESANSDPMAVGSIDPVTVTAGEMSEAIMLGDYFSDADMDALTYEAESSADMIATAMVTADDSDPGAVVHMLTIEGHMAGEATITVTASDGMGGMDAMQTIMVTVESGALTMPTNVIASHDGTQVSITWEGGDNADTFTVVMVTRTADGGWDIRNAVYDQNLRGSTHTVSMETRPAGMYVIGVSAGREIEDGVWEFTNWASGSLDYQP